MVKENAPAWAKKEYMNNRNILSLQGRMSATNFTYIHRYKRI